MRLLTGGDRENCTTVYPGGVDLMAETVTETCDGDGWVSENSSNVQENDYFWQQLKNTELFYSAKSIAWEPGAYRVANPVSDIYLGVGAVLAFNINPRYNFIVLGGDLGGYR